MGYGVNCSVDSDCCQGPVGVLVGFMGIARNDYGQLGQFGDIGIFGWIPEGVSGPWKDNSPSPSTMKHRRPSLASEVRLGVCA